jgi:DNA-binding protein Fis
VDELMVFAGDLSLFWLVLDYISTSPAYSSPGAEKRRISQVMKTRSQMEVPMMHAPVRCDKSKFDALTAASHALAQAIEILVELDLVDNFQTVDLSQGVDFYAEVTGFEIKLIRLALTISDGSQKRAASVLGLRLTTLNSMIKKYKIECKHVVDVQSEHDHLAN